ncbi:type II secretion system F family protein [Paenibacillus sp. NEAU-GSW1]|uniref:type II secretion system F family protein n=1 Tax=Paenibacillus sp. NEAU-GSW1 TaxID=2682486 RepID=UPI0012E0EC4B|nr:type II secretion system F family protein [Paenibacillus sp. NEAU-GSW1]MUT68066.1 type II secretion protein F [Paenibacillus sp. NEAU-GSW1]
MIAALLLLIIVWVWLIGRQGMRQLAGVKSRSKGKAQFRQYCLELFLVDPFVRLLNRSGVYDQLQLPFSSFHAKQIVLRGLEWQMEQSKRLIAAAAGYGYAAVAGCALMACLSREPALLAIGCVIGGILLFRPLLEAGRMVERRKQLIILELPELLSKLMLLVGAGETVQQAFARCMEGKDPHSHPLYNEWSKVVYALRMGDPFSAAAERFNRSCSVQEVSVFTTVLLLNYRRGGEHFVLALRELSYTLWEKRKAVARTRGEEASSKLVFPLVGILLVLMVFVASPAMLLMS